MRDFLTYLREQDSRSPASAATTDFGQGRGAELRRKYAAKLDEQARKALRAGAAVETFLRLNAAISPLTIPAALVDIYRIADGECSSGFLLPDIEFMRIDYVMAAIEANARVCEMEVLPKHLTEMIPFMRDGIGNQILVRAVNLGEPSDESIYFLDAQELRLSVISNNLFKFFKRIEEMHCANKLEGAVVCPGDFRFLTVREREIARAIEGT